MVDDHTGIPVRYYLRDQPAEETIRDLPRLSAEDARQCAVRFLGERNINLDRSWVLTEGPLIDHGSAGMAYHFEWRKRVQGVFLPALVDVAVDARTGTVYSFQLVDDPVVVPLKWRLSASDAIAVVARSRGWSRWNLQDVKLRVTLGSWLPDDSAGRQALVWNVQLTNPAGKIPNETYAVADVDAVTGEIVKVYTYGGAARADKKSKQDPKKLLAAQPEPKAGQTLSAPPTLFDLAKARK